jgi:hypothetical protein
MKIAADEIFGRAADVMDWNPTTETPPAPFLVDINQKTLLHLRY